MSTALDRCSERPYAGEARRCDRCGGPLTGRQTAWCSTACRIAVERQHDWNLARKATRKRDGEQCVRCGARGGYFEGEWPDAVWIPQLEVNHIEPRDGRGYGWGCWNHGTNLETLCPPCHREISAGQIAGRRQRQLERAHEQAIAHPHHTRRLDLEPSPAHHE